MGVGVVSVALALAAGVGATVAIVVAVQGVREAINALVGVGGAAVRRAGALQTGSSGGSRRGHPRGGVARVGKLWKRHPLFRHAAVSLPSCKAIWASSLYYSSIPRLTLIPLMLTTSIITTKCFLHPQPNFLITLFLPPASPPSPPPPSPPQLPPPMPVMHLFIPALFLSKFHQLSYSIQTSAFFSLIPFLDLSRNRDRI
ncbi:hypothetical protein E2C01_054192 [Portunus trituberculatus]|uniref:Uncharacterized protein n=1 Tax=Portunus trituberculatus TaxID=210409 RepID=A0A5B7GS39_PORTR|nr:hypothetical protein [Portunus trituberculatus]